MTEITVDTDRKRVSPGAFFAALILAPLLVGLPALAAVFVGVVAGTTLLGFLMLAVFPAAATIVGTPTHLLFRGPAFWWALERGMPIPAVAFVTNIVSLPFVAIYFTVTGGDSMAALSFFAVLGSIIAPLWGAAFFAVYQYLTGGETHV